MVFTLICRHCGALCHWLPARFNQLGWEHLHYTREPHPAAPTWPRPRED